MLMRGLVLLTADFPFGTGEAFLEGEIEYLAQTYDEIVLVPARADGQPRPLPSTVRVDKSLAERPHFGLSPRTRMASFVRRASMPPVLSSKALRRIARFARAALRFERWFELQPKSFRSNLFYSYWFEVVPVGLSLVKARWPDVRFVARAHRWDLYEDLYEPAFLPFREATLGAIERVFCVSAHGVEYLKGRYPAHANKIELSRLGVEPVGPDSVPSTDGVLRIASCSSLSAVKRVDLIVDAIALLARSRPVAWTHAGDGPLRSELESRARAVLPAAVEWKFLGSLPNSEVRALYAGQPVDAFVNTSVSEGVPVSIMEAQCAGIPVAATAVGGTREIVNDDNGVLLDANPTAESVAAALGRLGPESLLARDLRVGSKNTWCRHYDARINYPDFCRRLSDIAPYTR